LHRGRATQKCGDCPAGFGVRIRSLLCMVAAVLLAASNGMAETGTAPLVIVGAESAPIVYLIDGKPAGFAIEILQEAFRRAKVPVEIRVMPWARCLMEARSGRADAIFPTFITAQREEFLDFPHEPLLFETQSFFVRSDAPIQYEQDFSAYANLRVGVVNGTSYGPIFDKIIQDNQYKNIELYKNIDGMVKMISANRIDIIADDRVNIIYRAKEFGMQEDIRELSPPIRTTPSFLAFVKGGKKANIRDALDAALRSMREDGTYRRLSGEELGDN
jgi:polar amino acid transport system substrate-binding protein